MTTLRLIADDLTGALDTAAEFVPLTGPVHVFWQADVSAELPLNAAFDVATREIDPEAARAATLAALPALLPAGIAFKKIDSLIRGNTLVELAACVAAGPWHSAILAPAFPFQNRVTRDGKQFALQHGSWMQVGPNLILELQKLGLRAQIAGGGPLLPGVTIFDAETDIDLLQAVERSGGAEAPVLWCGTGGLARALAGGGAPASPRLPGPVVGFFGSDQHVTAEQVAACHPHWYAVVDSTAASASLVATAIGRHGVAAITHALPPGTTRHDAALRIEAVFRGLVEQLPAPGTLVAAGGETLRGLCVALGAASLEVIGSVTPGVPVSILRGGRWDGVTVVSKSGAFGHPTLLRELLRVPDLERATS